MGAGKFRTTRWHAGADISATRAWATTTGSDKVVVAVLDSGVDYTHEDLAPTLDTAGEYGAYRDDELGTIDDVNGFNAIDNTSDPMDENGHGTHCAGIIGAEGGTVGIAGELEGSHHAAQVYECGWFRDHERRGRSDQLRYRSQEGGRERSHHQCQLGLYAKSRALEDIIRKAYENDILFVAAREMRARTTIAPRTTRRVTTCRT